MKKLTIALSILLITVSQSLTAQDLNDAGKAYNEGISFTKENNQIKAIESYRECAEICEELGEEGEELMIKAQTQISSLSMKLGIDAFKAKDYDAAVSYFSLSTNYAEKTGNSDNVKKAKNYTAISYTAKGNSLYKEKKYEDAISFFHTALEFNSEYFQAYYGLAKCYNKTGNTEDLEESVNKVIELGGENKNVEKAKTLASKYFLKLSGEALQKESFNEASMMAEKSIEYNYMESAAYYYQALANNNLRNWDEAIKAAQTGMKAEQEDKSNLFFELGRAFEGKSDIPQACEAYGKVTSGPNVDAANYQRTTVLHCN
jgi:tetratricopeptide (TPR) repeat protein